MSSNPPHSSADPAKNVALLHIGSWPKEVPINYYYDTELSLPSKTNLSESSQQDKQSESHYHGGGTSIDEKPNQQAYSLNRWLEKAPQDPWTAENPARKRQTEDMEQCSLQPTEKIECPVVMKTVVKGEEKSTVKATAACAFSCK